MKAVPQKNECAVQGEASCLGPDLVWVDFDFGYSTVCLILLGLMADLAGQLVKMSGTSKSKSTQPMSEI